MQNQIPDYKNKNLSFEERAKDLVSRMTLEEKVTQMLHSAPAIPRLGIKAYNWWNKPFWSCKGRNCNNVSSFGMAATFDEDLIYKVQM